MEQMQAMQAEMLNKANSSASTDANSETNSNSNSDPNSSASSNSVVPAPTLNDAIEEQNKKIGKKRSGDEDDAIIIGGDNEDDNQIKKQKVEPAGNPFESQDSTFTNDGESQFFDPNEMESQPQLNSDEDD